MTDPQWTAEFTLRDNKTGTLREVRIESPELSEAMVGAMKAMATILGVELAGAADRFRDGLKIFDIKGTSGA